MCCFVIVPIKIPEELNDLEQVNVMSNVGTRIVFEDDQIIVWHLSLEPGEQGDMHTHTRDYVVRIVSGSTIEVSGPAGEVLYTVEVETGGIVNFRIDGDQVVSDRPGQVAIPTTHRARNVGSNTFREVLIEFKPLSATP